MCPGVGYIVNVPGFTLKKVTGFSPMIIDVAYRRKPKCIYCGNRKVRIKDAFTRRVRHENIGLRRTYLRFKAHKFYCNKCSKYFNERFDGILPHARASQKAKEQIFHLHNHGVCQKSIASDFACGASTVERYYHELYDRENKKRINRHCPALLGIDEHSFNKKAGYATTFCDLKKHKVFDVVKGRSARDLESYMRALPGKDRVKFVCIDLSPSYRSLVKRYFPNAKIVTDRFHVIRLLNHSLLETVKKIDPNIKYQRGLISLFRTNPENLTPHKLAKRNSYFKQQPATEAVYDFKQQLHQLLMRKNRTKEQCKRLIVTFLRYVEQLKNSPFDELKKLGRTLYRWRDEVVCMWRFTKSNGITEGFHRKMKLIQRKAYGMKNFDNYQIRVRVLCS